MSEHEVMKLIKKADRAISAENFDALMEFYTEDAVLVVQPGQVAKGKSQIRRAFEAIANHFGNTLQVTQGEAQVLDTGNTALVVMETVLVIGTHADPITRRATYVFTKDETGAWLCSVDNSYGTELLDAA